MFLSTKKYGHEVGLSCAFRQWRADSHCNQLHGYALAFKFTFIAEELDHRNWVMDFGGLKELKKSLELMFDHKTVVAEDDPLLPLFKEMESQGLCSLTIMPNTGVEMFARAGYLLADDLLEREGLKPRVHVLEVEVFEHGANSAIYSND